MSSYVIESNSYTFGSSRDAPGSLTRDAAPKLATSSPRVGEHPVRLHGAVKVRRAHHGVALARGGHGERARRRERGDAECRRASVVDRASDGLAHSARHTSTRRVRAVERASAESAETVRGERAGRARRGRAGRDRARAETVKVANHRIDRARAFIHSFNE